MELLIEIKLWREWQWITISHISSDLQQQAFSLFSPINYTVNPAKSEIKVQKYDPMPAPIIASRRQLHLKAANRCCIFSRMQGKL